MLPRRLREPRQHAPSTSPGVPGVRAGQPELFAHATHVTRPNIWGRANRMVRYEHHLRD